MRIEPWQPGDEAAIVELFQTVFQQPMSPDYWRWRYHDHPDGGPLVMLAWDGERLAGHYAASYAPLLLLGERRLAALSMTTMTHPDYRGKGLLERCATALYDRLSEADMLAIWGFPNRNVNVPRRQKLAWEAIADVPVLSRVLRTDDRFGSTSLTEVDHIDARFDMVRSPDAAFCGAHSHSFLQWRLDRNPSNRYIRLTLPSSDGLAGYAILKSYKETEFDLVHLAAIDAKAYPDLIAGCLAKVQAQGAARLNCWSLPQDETRIPLEKAGFQPVAPITYFGGRALALPLPDFSDPREWRISMIDSDIY